MIRAVLFDLDGVLVDTYDVWVHLMDDVARRLGYPRITRESLRTTWGQGVEADVAAFFPRHTLENIRRLYADHYAEHLGHLRVMDGAADALRAIKLPKAVVTNSLTGIARQALRIGALEEHFDTVVGADAVPRSKPAPDMVFEACRRLAVAPAEALVVGDSRFDEEAARAAGVPFVMFKSFAELRIP